MNTLIKLFLPLGLLVLIYEPALASKDTVYFDSGEIRLIIKEMELE